MKKQVVDKPVDKTKQQFKLGEHVYAVTQRHLVDCLVEGRICGIHKELDNENAEVFYTVGDISENKDRFNPYFDAAYDNIFKDLDAAEQRVLDAVAQTYEKVKADIATVCNTIKAGSAKQEAAKTMQTPA